MEKPITIKPPEGCDSKDIKKDITMHDDVTTVLLTYPNGFQMRTVIKDNEYNVTLSGELIDLGNGIFQVPK